MALPVYFQRPRAPYAVFEWTGSNLDDVRAWYEANYQPQLPKPAVNEDGTLSIPVEGGTFSLAVGDKLVLGPTWYDILGPLTDDQIADQFTPITERP